MSQSSVYEAAAEIREALRNVTDAINHLPGERAILTAIILAVGLTRPGARFDHSTILDALGCADAILVEIGDTPFEVVEFPSHEQRR